jgi:high-affinity iron transporter
MKIPIVILTLILGLALAAGSANAADGGAVYTANCASCHGASGAGDTPVGAAMKIPPLQGKSADAVSKHVSEAANHAQAKGKLSDGDLAAVSDFVATFK